jgi:hypothetical protein
MYGIKKWTFRSEDYEVNVQGENLTSPPHSLDVVGLNHVRWQATAINEQP